MLKVLSHVIPKLMPKEEMFFTFFEDLSNQIALASDAFKGLIENPKEVESRVQIIQDFEHKGDHITHQTISLLHQTFITPIDREDIHRLITKMDDILDFMNAAAQRILLFEVREFPEPFARFSEITIEASNYLQKAIPRLSTLNNGSEILKICVEMNRLENEADVVLRTSLAKLFKEETDIKKLIKYKEVYELLEAVTDRFEDVANILEGIVLEYA